MLWVDALCINQQDIPERNDQVKKMCRIYSKASCVLIWLGAESKTSGLAVSTLELIYMNLKSRGFSEEGAVRHDLANVLVGYAAGVGDEHSARPTQDVLDATEELLSSLFGDQESLIRIKAVEDLLKRP